MFNKKNKKNDFGYFKCVQLNVNTMTPLNLSYESIEGGERQSG